MAEPARLELVQLESSRIGGQAMVWLDLFEQVRISFNSSRRVRPCLVIGFDQTDYDCLFFQAGLIQTNFGLPNFEFVTTRKQHHSFLFFDTVAKAKIMICNLYEMGHEDSDIMIASNLMGDLNNFTQPYM